MANLIPSLPARQPYSSHQPADLKQPLLGVNFRVPSSREEFVLLARPHLTSGLLATCSLVLISFLLRCPRADSVSPMLAVSFLVNKL